MEKLQKQIEAIIHGRAASPPAWLTLTLRLLAVAFASAVKLRGTCYRRGICRSGRLPCFVISIGNITAGGTGKTPMAQYVAERCRAWGFKTAIVSRGYGGTFEKDGGIVADGRTLCMRPHESGDEPFLLASCLKTTPVLVGSKRYATGMLAVRAFQPDVIVLDDAFQHLAVQRDLDIVLLDAAAPVGNGRLLPAGPLREPISALSRSDTLILTRADRRKQTPPRHNAFSAIGKPLFHCFHHPYLAIAPETVSLPPHMPSDLQPLADHKVFAFSGIARNHAFRETLAESGCMLADFLEFPDHHHYSQHDLAQINSAAAHAGADCIVTTEKDWVRLDSHQQFRQTLWAIGIRIAFPDDTFDAFLRRKLSGSGTPAKERQKT